MKLQVMFVIAVVALFGALSAISVSADPGDGVSDAPVRSDRVSDVQITDACNEVADLCSDGGTFCRAHPELCRRIAQFCHESPELCRTIVQFCHAHPDLCRTFAGACLTHPAQCAELIEFCRTHQRFCERIVEFCKTHDVRCFTLISTCIEQPERCRNLIHCILHPDRCHDRPADRPVRDHVSDRQATDRRSANAVRPFAGVSS